MVQHTGITQGEHSDSREVLYAGDDGGYIIANRKGTFALQRRVDKLGGGCCHTALLLASQGTLDAGVLFLECHLQCRIVQKSTFCRMYTVLYPCCM